MHYGQCVYTPSYKDILDCSSECMTDVQAPSNVRGRLRDNKQTSRFGNRISIGIVIKLGFEESGFEPPIVPRRLNSEGIVSCWHRTRHIYQGDFYTRSRIVVG